MTVITEQGIKMAIIFLLYREKRREKETVLRFTELTYET